MQCDERVFVSCKLCQPFYVATHSKIQQDFSLNVAPCSRRGQEDFRREIMAKLVILYAAVIVYSVRI